MSTVHKLRCKYKKMELCRSLHWPLSQPNNAANMDLGHVEVCKAGLGPGTIPGVEYKDRRRRFAARSQKFLGEDLDEAREADGVLVE